MAVSQAGVCRATHVPRCRVLAATFSESKIWGAGMCGRDGQRDKLTRDERTMTCMQSVFFCFSPFLSRLSCPSPNHARPPPLVSRWAPSIGSLAIGPPYGSAATPATTCSTSVGRRRPPIGRPQEKLLVDFRCNVPAKLDTQQQ